jgi:hypothetical protein
VGVCGQTIQPESDMTRSSKDGVPEQIDGSEDSTCRCHTNCCTLRSTRGMPIGGIVRDMFTLDNKYGKNISLSELLICVGNLTLARGVEHSRKNYFPEGVMLKLTYRVQLLIIEKAYKVLLH